MPETPPLQTGEHPLDVLQFAIAASDHDMACALAVVTGTQGGAVRAPGALMAIRSDGETCGYLSGGCIDQDVALRAGEAIRTQTPVGLVYGQGSPFEDIKLPCGGRIDVRVLPHPGADGIRAIIAKLAARQPVSLRVTETNLKISAEEETHFTYHPKLRLRVAGRGADLDALSRVARAAGLGVELWSPEPHAAADKDQVKLTTPAALPQSADDAYTAFVLAFHERHWETALLADALKGPAFYVGAVGSRATHAKRCDTLRDMGLADTDIDRIRGPIGLVPSLRDASRIAISTLAEIIAADQERQSV